MPYTHSHTTALMPSNSHAVGSSLIRFTCANRRPSHSAVSAKLCTTSYTGAALGLVRSTEQLLASSSKTPHRRTNALQGTIPP